MKEDVRSFLESGILEKYLMGICNSEDLRRVEHYIEHYPEVQSELESLKQKINKEADQLKQNSPQNLKEAIISCLEDDTNYKLKSTIVKKPRFSMTMLPWAAAIIGIISTITFFNQNQDLQRTNMELHAEHNMVVHQLETAQQDIELYRQKLAISGHNKTERIFLAGNDLSPEFQSTAFWNDVAGKAILYINELGQLDKNHCYQIWADVDGRMVNVGVIPWKEGPIELNYLKNATSLNITIEPKGGSNHPTVERLISSKDLVKL